MTMLVVVAQARQQPMKAVKKMITREVADDVGIFFGTCQAIFTDVLCMKRAAVKFVTKLLNSEQNQRRMDKKVITCDESWVYGYDIETIVLSFQMKSFCYD